MSSFRNDQLSKWYIFEVTHFWKWSISKWPFVLTLYPVYNSKSSKYIGFWRFWWYDIVHKFYTLSILRRRVFWKCLLFGSWLGHRKVLTQFLWASLDARLWIKSGLVLSVTCLHVACRGFLNGPRLRFCARTPVLHNTTP